MTAPVQPDSTLVDLADFKLWPGVVVDDTQDNPASMVLEAATAYVRAESGDPARWPDRASAPAIVKQVVIAVAARFWRNPDGAVQTTTGPFSDMFPQAVREGMHLTDDERRIIAQQVAADTASGVPGLWTQPTTRCDDPLAASPGYWDCWSGETIPGSPYPDGSFLWGGAP